MGLESVELLLSIEKEFDVSISDEAAGKIFTIGDLFEWLKVSMRDRNIADQDIWKRLVQVFVDQCGIHSERRRGLFAI